jgi:tRNA threonylcarbamoyladenosine biosynthesis protein TsaB
MSKKYLFLDTSAYIQMGLLNEDLEWTHYEVVQNRKGSQLLHKIIYESMKNFDLSFGDIKGVILGNGPGSYTGIRIGEGVAQILALEGIDIISFYHYEVPAFCGITQYKFYEKAFKGEVFEYSKTLESEDKKLISEEKFKNLDLGDEHNYHLTGELFDQFLNSIYALIKKNPQEIFSKIIKRAEHLPPYYFRPLEKEFKVSGVKN